MTRSRTKRKGDVSWYAPRLKKAIAYSTIAEKLSLEFLVGERYNTPLKILELAKKRKLCH